MSMTYCEHCDKHIDTDLNGEHIDEIVEDTANLKEWEAKNEL